MPGRGKFSGLLNVAFSQPVPPAAIFSRPFAGSRKKPTQVRYQSGSPTRGRSPGRARSQRVIAAHLSGPRSPSTATISDRPQLQGFRWVLVSSTQPLPPVVRASLSSRSRRSSRATAPLAQKRCRLRLATRQAPRPGGPLHFRSCSVPVFPALSGPGPSGVPSFGPPS